MVSERLVDLTRRIQFSDLPPEVVQEAGNRLLDALGCMMAGSNGETTRKTRESMSKLGGRAESTIIGTREMTSCEKATLVNATALRFLDFMDGHPGPYPCHPCFNIPAILAVAERVGASGQDLVTAITIGYEMMSRLQETAGLPDLTSRGWSGCTNLAVSVPLALVPLLGLSRAEALSALGISVSHSHALDAASTGQMPMSKSILDGMTAMTAVVAAMLAKEGISGPGASIEGEGGYVEAITGTCDFEGLLAPVRNYKILETYTKAYNSVKCGQTAVAAALGLLRENGLKWRDIASLRIGLAQRDSRNQSENPSYTRPKSRDSANHSVRYCVAAALVEGELGPDQFDQEKLESRDILEFVDRTSVYWEKSHDAHWPSTNPATIEVRTSDGKEFTKSLIFGPGHPRDPLPRSALEQKFQQLSRQALDQRQRDAAISLARNLQNLPDVRKLTQALRPH